MPRWTRTLLASLGAAVITFVVAYLILTSVRPESKTSVAKGDRQAISVVDALAADRGGKVAVRGFVFIDENVGELLCSERTKDDPPACAGVALTLVNLDPNRLELVLADETKGNYDAWSRDTVTFLGRVDRSTFTVEEILAS